jgi:hypothetical protein
MSVHTQRRFTPPAVSDLPIPDVDHPRPAIVRQCPDCRRLIGPMLATDVACPRRRQP